MKKATWCIALGVLAGSLAASADTVREFTGTNCLGYGTLENVNLARLNSGCTNVDNEAYPVCGQSMVAILPISGNLSTTETYNDIKVNFVNNSTSIGLDCTVAVVNSAGTTYSSSTLTNTTNGVGQFHWNNSDTSHVTPNGNGTTHTASAISGILTQHIYCHIPPQMAKIGSNCEPSLYAWITNYEVSTTNP